MNHFKILLTYFFFGISVISSSQEYLALGDSYTIGESVLEFERWPNQLATLLEGTPLEVESVRIIAKTGWTTSELIQGINQEQNLQKYDLVS